MPRLFLSAGHKSSGKTTITLGLGAALAARGLSVQPFKKGPDYIDPVWLGQACGRPCYNLDFNTQGPEEITAMVASRAADADIALIEGNKGLYDGVALDGSDSSAALATLTRSPVVLVLDAVGTTRGVAPLVLGYQAFDGAPDIAGVILNKVGGARHESKLRAVLEAYTDVPVLGALGKDDRLSIDERHLGLIPANEEHSARAHIDRIAEAVTAGVDLDRVIAASQAAAPLAPPSPRPSPAARGDRLVIGIARDEAFGFYYQDDLETLAAAGAEAVFFSTLSDSALPAGLDGLFLGGGFPETHAMALEANAPMRRDILDRARGGLPIYAECGGLMYLSRSLVWRGERHQMVGLIPGDAVMRDAPSGRGIMRLRERPAAPWPIRGAGSEIPCHEFHYSALENLETDGLSFAYDVLRGAGVDGVHDGLRIGNTLASYAHLRHTAACPWIDGFLGFVRSLKKNG